MPMADATSVPSPTPPLRAASHPLWDRLLAFDFDAPAGPSPGKGPPIRPFSRRLAEEQGWTLPFAGRVLEEYRRFLFLTAVADHPVCPSEEVDAAWHLHLIFTRSYWGGLCGRVLGRPLHHDASGGGPAEGRKHREMYRRTLAAYRAWFGAEPPVDIWPPAWRRFDARSLHRTVDLRAHWVIRRPAWWPERSVARASLATVPLAAATPLVAEGLGPLDLRGPEFLFLFGGLWVICWAGTLVWRSINRVVDATDDREPTPEEIAVLSHGPTPAVRATVAGMLKGGDLKFETTGWLTGSSTNFLLRSGDTDTPLEGEIAAAIRGACSGGPRNLASLEGDTGVVHAAEEVRGRLQSRGWLLDDDRRVRITVIPAIVFSCLLLLGLAKIGVGLSRERPVGFLVVGCVLTVIALIWAAWPPRVSQAGVDLITTLRAQHRQAQAGSAGELVLLAGLFGAAALTGDELAPYKKVWQSSTPQGGSGGCGSGCGGTSGGCGGGGGDGGGGCGGGCGGCGGD